MRGKLTQIEHTNIDHKVYQIITEQILAGVLEPGVRLTEEELAAGLGVSRTPVREAMKRLAQDELVELLPRRGVYVKKLTREDVEEVYEVRMALEGLATHLIASRITENDLAELKKELELAQQELSIGRLEAWLKFDAKLHSKIVEGCGNRRLCRMIQKLNNLVGYFRTQVAQKSERVEQALREHKKILSALDIGDSRAAEDAMKAHIQASKENILKDIYYEQIGVGK